MKEKIKKRIIAALFIAMPVLSLTACGGSSVDESTVQIDAEGAVKSIVFEEFDESYYDIDELKEMAVSEIDTFNADYISPRVFFEEAELSSDGTMAKLMMNYRTAKDFTDFNGTKLFYGTVEDAEKGGYTISDKLVNKNGDVIDAKEVSGNPERHVIITNESSNIIAPYNIEYMTPGVELKGKKEAVLSSVSEDTVQLLLSK